MQRDGWTLLFHECLVDQLRKLETAVARAQRKDPMGFDSKSRIIIYAWVNDENTLRSAGSRSDPYAVFQGMLERGNPPDDWATLQAASKPGWK